MQDAPFFDSLTDVFWWNFNATERTVINQGGTSSSKTYSILQVLAIKATSEKNIITVVGQDLPNLKKGAMRDFERIVKSSTILNGYIQQHNRSENVYLFKNGSIIEFTSYKDEQDARSGKRQYLFLNECNGIGYDVYEALQVRTDKQIYLDYNATAPFWVHEKVIGKPDTIRFISNYTNNQFISEAVKEQIRSYKHSSPYRWRVFGLGLTGVTDDERWLHSFDRTKHVKPCKYNPAEPVHISIDFNVGKFVCIAFQCSDVDNHQYSYFHVIKEFVLRDANIEQMAAHIKQTYPANRIFITGDQSGARQDTGYSKSNDTLLTILQRSLGVGNGQMLFGSYSKRYPAANPSFQNSWAHCNMAFAHHRNLAINPDCKELIADCERARFDKRKGGFVLHKGDGGGDWAMNAFDCLRYAINIKMPSYQNMAALTANPI